MRSFYKLLAVSMDVATAAEPGLQERVIFSRMGDGKRKKRGRPGQKEGGEKDVEQNNVDRKARSRP